MVVHANVPVAMVPLVGQMVCCSLLVGLVVRVPVTRSRCVLTPYGVQVMRVTRSLLLVVSIHLKSFGSTTVMLVTWYVRVSPRTLMVKVSPSRAWSRLVNMSLSARPRCAVMTAWVPLPPMGRDVPCQCPAPVASICSFASCLIGSSMPSRGYCMVAMMSLGGIVSCWW